MKDAGNKLFWNHNIAQRLQVRILQPEVQALQVHILFHSTPTEQGENSFFNGF